MPDKSVPSAIAFETPPEFDRRTYDAIAAKLASYSQRAPSEWRTFAAGWNGVPLRFRAAFESHSIFAPSIGKSAGPPGEERYGQDHALFVFTVAFLSTIECFAFAVYAVASIIDPGGFPMSSDKELRFYPVDVADRLIRVFQRAPLGHLLRAALRDQQYATMADLRNYLGHRGSLPRIIPMSVGGGNSQVHPGLIPSNAKELSSSWDFNLTLGPELTAAAYDFLAIRVRELQSAFLELIEPRL